MLFILRAQYTIDGVRCAAARLVIVTYLHFAEQADGQQIESAAAGAPWPPSSADRVST